jgi:dihydroorotase
MNPPLRSSDDLQAVREGLADGTLNVIATDHAPHHSDEKNVEFNLALNGIIGLETALPLTLRLVEEGVLSLTDAIACLTTGPAKALNLPGGTLEVGRSADVTIIDPDAKWTMDPQSGKSRSSNTPFGGWNLKGRAVCTMVGGRITHRLS